MVLYSVVLSLSTLLLSPSFGPRRSKPHVDENLYTMKNTKKLTNTKTQAVTNLANKFKPDSFGSFDNGRCRVSSIERLRFVVMLLASAGNASDCVKVNLCIDSESEYGPTLPRAAALKRAYSKSNASSSEYLPVDRLRCDSICSSSGAFALSLA